jgi:predicted nucleic acid-binding protein
MNGVFIDSSVFLDYLEGKEGEAVKNEAEGLIKKIATADPDFKRVDFLEVITPE